MLRGVPPATSLTIRSRLCAYATCRPSGDIAGSRAAPLPLTLWAPEPSGLTTQTWFKLWNAIAPLSPGNDAEAGDAQTSSATRTARPFRVTMSYGYTTGHRLGRPL